MGYAHGPGRWFIAGQCGALERPWRCGAFAGTLEDFRAGTCGGALDDVKIEPLNYRWLSRTTSFPQHVVQSCVQETILLYSFQLRNRQHLAFAFKDIGVLSFTDDVLCMRFYRDCVTGLESKASWIALLNTRLWMPSAAASGGETSTRGMQAAPAHAFPRFRFTVVSRAVAKALSAWAKKAAAKSRLRQGAEAHRGKLLQRRTKLSLPALPSQGPGTRQKDMGKKTSESVLPPCPGSSPRMKEAGKAGRQEPASPAKPTSTLPSSDDCQRALQALGTGGTWTPHPPAQPRREAVKERWRKAPTRLPAEQKTAATPLQRLQPDHLSPRAVQVLRRLEPYLERKEIFKYVAENRRRLQEQQKQLPCTRCWYRSRGEGAGSSGCSSGC
ncbi:coiled-coil domain-containing protein 81-like isoform X2 [Falco cherrug]|uniref:coiled-coil domain-containing protein 81-like isoform X2 n=2 Tax=Falco TaxID=8952 RepID=UPI0024795D28|nr:coiled-coil domain-containing protein 81-like isoform X2 [Falco cherrug]